METKIAKPRTEKAFKNHLEIVAHYICQLDIDAVDMVLDSKLTYQDMHKDDFIRLLGKVFEKFKAAGDTSLKTIPGKCARCYAGDYFFTGYCFVGNNSLNYMNLLFEIKDEMVHDVFQCMSFRNQIEIENLGTKFYLTTIAQDDDAPF